MYRDIEQIDQMKSITNLFNADSRVTVFGLSLEKYFSLMEEAKLSDQVPKDIRIQFDVARNAFIFSHYSYRIGMLAQIQGFLVLEMALLTRLRFSKIKTPKKNPSLSELFQYALDNDWICDEALPPDNLNNNRSNDEELRCKSLKDYWAPTFKEREAAGFRGKRNHLVHDLGYLEDPRACAETLRKIAFIVNHIFNFVT